MCDELHMEVDISVLLSITKKNVIGHKCVCVKLNYGFCPYDTARPTQCKLFRDRVTILVKIVTIIQNESICERAYG